MDLLLVVDDSPGAAPMQARLAAEVPKFLQLLDTLPGGLPDLHLAVVSTSMGAGRFANVPGCTPGGRGDRGGRFMHPAACTALGAGHTFVIMDRGIRNFSGELSPLVECMVEVGANGCMFPQPLVATQRALEKAMDPRDADNGGFFRRDALLTILLVATEDDCSVPADSALFDPAQTSVADPLGALGPYRCAEFGHTCGGERPPHVVPAGVDNIPLSDCGPDDQGLLLPVGALDEFLKRAKPNADWRVVAGAVAPPPTPYVVQRSAVGEAPEVDIGDPVLASSCPGELGATGTPAPRIAAWTSGWGGDLGLQSSCTGGLSDVWARLAAQFLPLDVGLTCLGPHVALKRDGTPDCQVTTRTLIGDTGRMVDESLPLCDAHQTNYPCWRLVPGVSGCGDRDLFDICEDPTCTGWGPAYPRQDALVTCAQQGPCGG